MDAVQVFSDRAVVVPDVTTSALIARENVTPVVVPPPVQSAVIVDADGTVLSGINGSPEAIVTAPQIVTAVHESSTPALLAVCQQGPPGRDGASASYTNEEPSVIPVGGIDAGTTFDGLTFDQFVDQLLYPELFPSLSGPSASFTSSQTGYREIGQSLNITFSTSFNRGSISPQYEAESPYRSGPAVGARFTGTGLTDVATLPDSQTVAGYIVQAGTQSWTGRVDYLEGPQPTGSKGSLYNSPLPAGSTGAITRAIIGVYPVYATTASIDALAKQSLTAHGATVTYDLAGETGDGSKQAVEFPVGWGTISRIEQWNPLSSSWDVLDMSTFTTSATSREVQGATVTYARYEHNGPTIGARRLRWTT